MSAPESHRPCLFRAATAFIGIMGFFEVSAISIPLSGGLREGWYLLREGTIMQADECSLFFAAEVVE
ncbi:hypothetical protein AU508_00840 [Lonsdalea populi]|nr:hypothetical protein AU508_00840 [Lonsdalea populi]